MKNIEFIVNEDGQVKIKSIRKIIRRRSIFAENYIIDDVTCEVKLVKHLNKERVDRSTRKSRMKGNRFPYNSKSQRKVEIENIE